MTDRTVALSIGSNEGNRLRNIERAINSLRHGGLEIQRASSVWETRPWGKTDQPRFLNMCLTAATSLEPLEILALTQKTENEIGRTKKEHWGPREIDIDIIFIGCEIINTPELSVPHPYMQQRAFVLVPLAEIAPDTEHPVLKKSVSEMLDAIPKEEMVWIMKF